MILTEDNYYSPEADQAYMSVSQYKRFLACEAAALAQVNGEYKAPETEALTVGKYVAAAVEGDEQLERFKREHPHIFSSRGPTKGELKTEYKKADVMVLALREDENCRLMLTGEKEAIVTADMFGVKWKAKMDIYNPEEGRIVDIKTAESLYKRYWKDGRKQTFVEYYGYDIQMAVYSELERRSTGGTHPLEPLLMAVTKEDVPDKAIICFDELSLAQKLFEVQERLPRIVAIKEGIEEPRRCNTCRYCRMTKDASQFIHYLDLLEVDYA